MGPRRRPGTGFSPSTTSCSKELRTEPAPKISLQITTRTPEAPDFKFELLPLHSQLLRQSLLVSFPPLIDMLKFSGYPYLIRGQPLDCGGFKRPGSPPVGAGERVTYYAPVPLWWLSAVAFRGWAPERAAIPHGQAGQTCPA
jgi:hypothetical protein